MKLRKLILEELEKFNKSNDRTEIKANDALMMDLFFGSGINEQDVETSIDLKSQVVDMINSNQWEEPNPESFLNSLMQSKHKEMLTVYSTSELSQMKLFKLPNYNIGYALKNNEHAPHSEVVAVHNNEPSIKGIGEVLMQSAIRNGGCYLDHFDSEKLTNLYSSLGYEEIGRDEYNAEYDPDGDFKGKYGELAVIYRKHRNC